MKHALEYADFIIARYDNIVLTVHTEPTRCGAFLEVGRMLADKRKDNAVRLVHIYICGVFPDNFHIHIHGDSQIVPQICSRPPCHVARIPIQSDHCVALHSKFARIRYTGFIPYTQFMEY